MLLLRPVLVAVGLISMGNLKWIKHWVTLCYYCGLSWWLWVSYQWGTWTGSSTESHCVTTAACFGGCGSHVNGQHSKCKIVVFLIYTNSIWLPLSCRVCRVQLMECLSCSACIVQPMVCFSCSAWWAVSQSLSYLCYLYCSANGLSSPRCVLTYLHLMCDISDTIGNWLLKAAVDTRFMYGCGQEDQVNGLGIRR